MVKLWLNSIDEIYEGSEPYFYDVEQFSWVPKFEHAFQQIENQVGSLVGAESKRYNVYFQHELQYPSSSWSTISLLSYGLEHRENTEVFPELYDELLKIPGIVTAYFSRMRPGSHILPHCGPVNATIRFHFGIIIPSTKPEECAIKVGNKTKTWTKHGFLAFLDAHKHEAWNNTDKNRIVLIIDTIRPEFASQARLICSTMIFSYALFKFISWLKAGWITDYLRGKKLSNEIQKIGGFIAYPFSYFFLKHLK